MNCFCPCEPDEAEAVSPRRTRAKNMDMNETMITVPSEQIDKQSTYNMTELIESTTLSTAKIFDDEYIFNYINSQINGAKSYHDLQHLIHFER